MTWLDLTVTRTPVSLSFCSTQHTGFLLNLENPKEYEMWIFQNLDKWNKIFSEKCSILASLNQSKCTVELINRGHSEATHKSIHPLIVWDFASSTFNEWHPLSVNSLCLCFRINKYKKTPLGHHTSSHMASKWRIRSKNACVTSSTLCHALPLVGLQSGTFVFQPRFQVWRIEFSATCSAVPLTESTQKKNKKTFRFHPTACFNHGCFSLSHWHWRKWCFPGIFHPHAHYPPSSSPVLHQPFIAFISLCEAFHPSVFHETPSLILRAVTTLFSDKVW